MFQDYNAPTLDELRRHAARYNENLMPSTFVNLTPHPITLVDEEGDTVTLPASGTVARVAETREQYGVALVLGHFVPVVRKSFGQVENLPEPSPDAFYIVSGMVKSAVPDRLDVYAPDDFVRDEAGRIVGAKALQG